MRLYGFYEFNEILKKFIRFYDFMRSGRSENSTKMITIKHVVNTKQLICESYIKIKLVFKNQG